MIEKLAFVLAKNIYLSVETEDIHKNNLKNEEIEVLRYGIECIINMSIPLMFLLVYAWHARMLLSAIIWFATFLALRNYFGGYHASSHLQFILYSCGYEMICLYGILKMMAISLKIKLLICGGMLLFNVWLGPVIYDIYLERYRQRFYKYGIIVLSGEVTLAIFLKNFNQMYENAVFMGIFSAEILYLIAIISKAGNGSIGR